MTSVAEENPFLVAALVAAPFTTSLASGVAVLSAGASVQAQFHSAEQVKVDAEIANREESVASRDREIARKKALLASIANQNVFSAAGGVQFSGSSANLARVSSANVTQDQLRDDISTRSRQRGNSARARSVRRGATIKLGTSLLDTGIALNKRGKPE